MEFDNIFLKNVEICKVFSDYFVNVRDELDIYNWGEDVSYYWISTSRMSVFHNHNSIRLIKDKYNFNFKFEFIFTNQVLKYINETDCNKSSGGDNNCKNYQNGLREPYSPNNKLLKNVYFIKHFSG